MMITDNDDWLTDDFSEGEIITFEEIPAQFPGGEEAFKTFINSNIRYPAEALEKNLVGTVKVMFTVKANGTVGNITFIETPHRCFISEVIRLLWLMPDWMPATQNGVAVPIKYTLPVNFKIDQ